MSIAKKIVAATPIYMSKNPTYCKCDHLCYYSSTPLDITYKGKYARKQCGHCWCNSLKKPEKDRKQADRTKIRVHKNTCRGNCVCGKKLEQKDYVVNLGFLGKAVVIHIGCIDLFIQKLLKFQKEELPAIREKITVETL